MARTGQNEIAFLLGLIFILAGMAGFDDIDRRILRELTRDGRIRNQDLAQRVGLSASACLRRVRDLEAQGVIRGYRALLDREQVGRGYLTYVAVGLSDHSKEAQAAFERAMQAAPEVMECHNVAGAFEYLLRVETRDLAAYKVFHADRLGTAPHVRAITSYMVMGTPKDIRA